MGRKFWWVVGSLFVLAALIPGAYLVSHRNSTTSLQTLLTNNDSVYIVKQPARTARIVVPQQVATPTTAPTVQPTTAPTPSPTAPPAATEASSTPTSIPSTGTGSAPYGAPPAVSTEESQLTQQLFALINSDRAARGLYPYIWDSTLAGGARLHSWNMVHCGFNHTCPDGSTPCQRIRTEGFAKCTDCGENIGYAGPYPTAWKGVYNIQESMANEPPTGWHRIYLFSKTIHRIGVGIYVDPSGYIWFTEDLVS